MSATVDLHLHTTASDGRLPPRELVRLASDLGLKQIAISDHDTTEGLPEFRHAIETRSILPEDLFVGPVSRRP